MPRDLSEQADTSGRALESAREVNVIEKEEDVLMRLASICERLDDLPGDTLVRKGRGVVSQLRRSNELAFQTSRAVVRS